MMDKPVYFYILLLDSGHFYTYIKDFGFDKWFKFNDMNVNVETKQKVF